MPATIMKRTLKDSLLHFLLLIGAAIFKLFKVVAVVIRDNDRRLLILGTLQLVSNFSTPVFAAQRVGASNTLADT
jgi:hypothetical protein